MDLSNFPLQFLRVFGEKLELGTVSLWVFSRIIVTDFSCKQEQKLPIIIDFGKCKQRGSGTVVLEISP